MKIRNKSLLRALTALVAAVMLLASMPCSALAESFSAVVTAKSMYVAADAKGKKILGKLPKNTVVTVKSFTGDVAQIKYQGKSGYAKISDLATVDSVAEKAVTTVNTYAYKKPNVNSKSVKVKAGTKLNVLATKGKVAMVEKNGVVCYMYRKHLVMEEQITSGELSQKELEELKEHLQSQQKEKDKNSKTPTLTEAFKSGKYSNEQLCYLFLTQAMGYNTAAAAGVLANINYESGFKTTINGDGGTSYGICQWHASRKTRLLNYCADNGLDSDSLAAQLAYLKYELENYYPMVHRYLKGVSNTAEGAYDAGYYFCYNYEAPAARASQSVKRGSSAQSTYFSRYA